VLKQIPEAQSAVESAVQLYEKFLEEKPDETDIYNQLDQLAVCYRKLFETSKHAGNNKRAIELLRREITLTNEQPPDFSRDYRLAEANLLLGELLAISGQASEAHRLIHRAIKLYDQLAAESPYDPSSNNATAAEGYMQVAAFCVATPGYADEFDKVNRKLIAVLPKFLSDFPAAGNSYYRLAFALTSAHRDQEAAELVRQAVLSAKRITDASAMANAHYCIALMQLRLGDNAGYYESCKALVELPAGNLDETAKSRPIWTPCLVPNALEDVNPLVTRAEECLATTSLNRRHFALCLLGAVLYRAGQYEQAAQPLEESIAAYNRSTPIAHQEINYSRLFLTMTKWQLGQKNEARQLLAETLAAVDQELQSPWTSWSRRATLELLRAEAVALIEQKEADEAVETKSGSSDKPQQ
jgi:tetratricopeptide (TPR) repeat protein